MVGHVVRQHSGRDQNFIKWTPFHLSNIIFFFLQYVELDIGPASKVSGSITSSPSLVSLGVTWRILPGSHISSNWWQGDPGWSSVSTKGDPGSIPMTADSPLGDSRSAAVELLVCPLSLEPKTWIGRRLRLYLSITQESQQDNIKSFACKKLSWNNLCL